MRCDATYRDTSPLVAGRMVARLAEHIAYARVFPIMGAGHMYPVTHGKEIANVLERVLKRSS